MKKFGKLYIVPTPIGNLGDITIRAIDVLKKVDVIAAEDTRTSGKLLKHYSIETPMKSYHKYNESKRSSEFIGFLHQGKSVAIISDAGSPGISDPANILIRSAIEHNVKITALPGATALIPAYTLTGFKEDKFLFIGFLPKQKKSRAELLNKIVDLPFPIIFYEAPHKLNTTLRNLYEVCGNREIVIARELTKLHEELYRTELEELIGNFAQITLKGEFVIIMKGAEKTAYSDAELQNRLRSYMQKGDSKTTAVKKVMKDTEAARNRIYELVTKL